MGTQQELENNHKHESSTNRDRNKLEGVQKNGKLGNRNKQASGS